MNLNEIKDPKLRERIQLADFLQNSGHAKSAVNKHNPANGAVESDAGEASNAVRCFALVKICCFRVRSLDDDNPFEKYFVDALRYSGAIFDDKKEWCKIEVEEKLVNTKAQERTEIEVAYQRIITDTSGQCSSKPPNQLKRGFTTSC